MTDVLTCRLPLGEAELFRVYAKRCGKPVSQAIREALEREVKSALSPRTRPA